MASTASTSSHSPSSHNPGGANASPPISPADPSPVNKQEKTTEKKSTLAEWDENITRYLPLYRAALHGEWEVAKAIIDRDPDALSAKITRFQETVLHIAVSTGHSLHFVRNLVSMMSVQGLEQKDHAGYTALSFAAICGNLEAAKILVGKNRRLPQMPNNRNDIPLHSAASFGHKDLVEYLLSVTTDDPPHPFSGQSGAKLLNLLITADFYGIALQLLYRYPNLALEEDNIHLTALKKLARKPQAFRSGSHLGFWQRLFYDYINVSLHQPPLSINPDDVENPSQPGSGRRPFNCGALIGSCWNTFGKHVPFLNKIHDAKLMHMQAHELVRVICREAVKAHPRKTVNLYSSPLFMASTLGIRELVFEAIKSFPYIVWFTDSKSCNIFQLAVLHRKEKVFNLIYQMSSNKHFTTVFEDKQYNNILHFAGRLETSNRISGAALQMQRELQWFKEVEKVVQPSYKERRNKDEKTPAMIFSEEHETLVKQGEKWMKVTASSCTVVAALIATVAFSAAFTAPGGNDNGGRPNFIDRPAFIVYAVSDAIALFSSSIAVMMFLGILTSRYLEEDFLESLPKKMIIGLLSLFISIASMVAAFSASLHLVLVSRGSWVLIPILIAAFVPVVLFALLQFPLLVEIINSTYGPSIFGPQSHEKIH